MALNFSLSSNLVKSFVTRELMRWPGIESIYGPFLQTTTVFSSAAQWEDLHTRVIEHVSISPQSWRNRTDCGSEHPGRLSVLYSN